MTITSFGRLVPLAPEVFAYIQPPGGWCVGNAGIIVGSEQVVVVDTAATRLRAEALLACVRRLAPNRPQIVVNTHAHGDHVFGNCVFPAEAVIVAHEIARAEMARTGLAMRDLWPEADFGGIDLRLPTVTMRDRLSLSPGGPAVELIHVGPAHTTNDVVVWLPRSRVLFTGDVVFAGRTPFVLMGSVSGSLRALAELRALRPRLVVSGHGEVGGPEVLDATEAYLRWLLREATRGIAANLDPLEAARQAAGHPFHRLPEAERLVANLHRAYAEERGEPPGTYLPSRPVMGDMVRLHGGPLSTSV
ncbi:MBL fold metallo-hydrolase [Actinoplanes derwentensis]|uniref:Cyclase n=1 Tax=Actinoplanes derwentensis TaxID=113562 RepID=A0A1H2D9D3_9ACTN|nr:MBL fold metallo-hydrolase [Actinoplanes derwentensis]GID89719.1 MBL fold metallo-hydrolase [Actinoplanes derwentensis]SDT78856.1 cyclase [Actinoplanes derwentensis]